MASSVGRMLFSLSRGWAAGLRPQRAPRPAAVEYMARRHLGARQYTSNAGTELQLLSCVKEEVELEQSQSEELPAVTGFTATISGCQATLRKECDSEKMTVHLDTHHAIEVMPEELGDNEEEGEPFFVPAFTVTITSPSGSQLQVDCSFDEHGQYVEQGKEWDNLTLDSVSVLETETQNPDNVYTVTADNLSSDLYESLLSYLQERGIDQRFAAELVRFYQVHEHICYLEHSLKALRKFLQKS